MSSVEPSATRRYKEVVAELSAAAGVVREADQKRAAQLRERLVGLADEMVRAGDRARLTAAGVQLNWERALDVLWAESWMRLRLLPEPDPDADPARLDEYDVEVVARAEELREVVRRRWYELGRR